MVHRRSSTVVHILRVTVVQYHQVVLYILLRETATAGSGDHNQVIHQYEDVTVLVVVLVVARDVDHKQQLVAIIVNMV